MTRLISVTSARARKIFRSLGGEGKLDYHAVFDQIRRGEGQGETAKVIRGLLEVQSGLMALSHGTPNHPGPKAF